jgi:hypothetical protein
MARSGLRMMPTFPSPSLKFRTVGFPQYGFKASLSGCACRRRDAVEWVPHVPASQRSFASTLRPCLQPATAWHCVQDRRRVGGPLCEGLRPSTPGVLGSGPSYVVSARRRVLRPHPPVSQARSDFTAGPLIHRAFAVRARLGDPRDLPYFHYCAVHTCRRPYAGGFAQPVPLRCGPRYQASSISERVATRE